MPLTCALLLLQPSAPSPAPTPVSLTGVFTDIQTKLTAALPQMLTGAIVFSVFLLFAWAGQRLIASVAPRVRADTGVVLLLSRVYYYGVIIFGLITALSTAGLNVSALVAGLGLTGFALGFALKDVLSNLVSGIMLLMYRPFHIGDQIRMGEYEGTIQNIRMRDTVVRGFDGRLIIIPNTKLITEVVINNAAVPLLREAVSFKLEVEADAEVAREIFVRAMLEDATLRGRVEPLVHVRRPDDQTTLLEGRFWYDPRSADKSKVREEVAQAVERAFAEAGVRASLVAAPASRPETGPKEAGREEPEETVAAPPAES
jgi:small-conductance mechanosensitive channel